MQCLRRPFAFGDVTQDAVITLLAIQFDDDRADLHVDDRTVLVHLGRLIRGMPFALHARQPVRDLVCVFRGDEFVRPPSQHVLLGIPQAPVRDVVEVEDPAAFG